MALLVPLSLLGSAPPRLASRSPGFGRARLVGVLRDGCLRRWLAILALCLALPPASLAQPALPREYQIKALFLFNFVQFVDWPAAAFESEASPLRIGVLGDDPFGAALDETVKGETVRNRPLEIRRADRAEDLRDCHLLFVCKSESRRADSALRLFRARPVLTVSDIADFARDGGVIRFFSDGKKIRFEINIGAAREAGLKISSELLGLGKIIGADSPAGGP